MEKAIKKQRMTVLVYLFVLTILLNILTVIYFYEQSHGFREFTRDNFPFFVPTIRSIIARYVYFYDMDIQYVIFLFWGIIFLSSFVGFIEDPKNPLFPNPLNLVATIVLCTVASLIVTIVYYWPDDTIHLGSIIAIYRGNPNEFSNSIMFTINILTIVYLYVFILNRLHLWAQQKDKIIG